MKISGYKLREALKEWELRRDAAVESFTGTLAKFEDEEKDSPETVAGSIAACDKAIARLQTVQAAYNLAIQVDLGDEKVSLCEAVKRVGGVQRIEKTWKAAMSQLAPGRSFTRNRFLPGSQVTQEEPKATMTAKAAQAQTSAAAKAAGKLRSAIAAANAIEIDVTDLDPNLIP